MGREGRQVASVSTVVSVGATEKVTLKAKSREGRGEPCDCHVEEPFRHRAEHTEYGSSRLWRQSGGRRGRGGASEGRAGGSGMRPRIHLT